MASERFAQGACAAGVGELASSQSDGPSPFVGAGVVGQAANTQGLGRTAGFSDLILQVEAERLEDINQIRDEIAKLPGVGGTQTLLVMAHRFDRGPRPRPGLKPQPFQRRVSDSLNPN